MSTPIAKSSSDDEEHNNEESEMIIEAMLWSVQEAGLQEAFAQNIGSNLQQLQGWPTDFFGCHHRCMLHFTSKSMEPVFKIS